MIKAGQLISDGSAAWIIDDVRDGARVGDIILRPTLRDGYIKANGATVKASEYPRLLAWVQESNMTVTAEQYKTDCSKYVYDAAQDKLTLPNAVGRVLQGGESVKSVEAGLPNIKSTQAYEDLKSPIVGAGQDGKIYGTGFMQLRPNANYYSAQSAGENPGNRINYGDVDFDASRVNPVYGASETVQPPALSLIAQIKY